MSYRREIKINLTFDEIRVIVNALSKLKYSYRDEIKKSTTKSGKAKKGQKDTRNYFTEELARTEKLESFFANLF